MGVNNRTVNNVSIMKYIKHIMVINILFAIYRTAKSPKIYWISTGLPYYSWFMTSPDTSNPDLINMLIINARSDSDLTNQTVIETYLAPNPEKGSGYNQYCIFLFTYSNMINYAKPKSRDGWNATAFQQFLWSNGAELQDSTYFVVSLQ